MCCPAQTGVKRPIVSDRLGLVVDHTALWHPLFVEEMNA